MRSLLLPRLILAILVVVFIAEGTSAQSHWWYPESGAALTLELEKPHFTEYYDRRGGDGFFNSIGFLGGRHLLSENLMLYWELPFANYDADGTEPIYYGGWEYYYAIDDEFAIGNPMVGLEQLIAGKSLFVRTSVRFPVASEKKEVSLLMGYLGAYDRFEAFLPKVYTINLDLGWREANEQSPLDAQVTLGTTTAVPNEGDAELFASYSSYFGFTVNRVQGGLFFGGRLILTEDYDDFTDRFMNFCGATFRIKTPVVEPGIEFRYNLDNDLNEISDYSYGINLAIPFGSDGDYSGDDWR